MSARDLVAHLAAFARALRAHDVPVRLSDEIDAAEALTLIDLGDRAEVREALLAALKIEPRFRAVFDELFQSMWRADAAPAPSRAPQRAPDAPRYPRTPRWSFDGRRVRLDLPEDVRIPQGDTPAFSPVARYRGTPPAVPDDTELRQMTRMLERLARRLATRRSRRLVPVRARGTADLRRTFRRTAARGGALLPLARRDRLVEHPRLVVLCDTSGSMDAHGRFLLGFMLSLKRIVRRTEVFAFNTALTRLPMRLAVADVTRAVDTLVAQVPDWSGGTRIGDSLAAFVADHLKQLVDRRTVVMIVSDGLDTGDVEVLARAMRVIHARARRVVWLNPLSADPHYRPAAAGMDAALPFVDDFLPAHDLASLERVLSLVAA